ncbi:MAG: Rid family hydrolase [Hyphomicrobiales bacterium]|nr:Rid family hydrolase [Hyphomicrobiales bacterium]
MQDDVRNALVMLRRILAEADSSLDRAVQVMMLITDPADYAACNQDHVRHFPAGLPARHTARIGVPIGARVDFSCIALAGTSAAPTSQERAALLQDP